jgi:putative copper export protein
VRRRHRLPARERRRRPRAGALLGPVLTGLWISLSDATPASAHAAGGGAASGVAGPRAVAVGFAVATLALLIGPLVAGTGRVDRVRGALGRLTPLVVAGLSASIHLSRPAQLIVVAAAAAVALAPVDSRWRAAPAVVLLAIVTSGSAGNVLIRDRALGGIHVVAGAFWLGLVIEVAVRWAGDPAAGRALLRRLSTPALVSVVAVATTGTVIASEHLGDARLALGSWWGRGLAIKVVLVVGAAVVGAVGRFRWAPRLEGSMLAVVAVIGTLLALGGSPLSGAAPLGPLLARDGSADVLVAPLQAGGNTVVVRGAAGAPPARVQLDGRDVALSARSDGLQVGEVDLRQGRHRIRVGAQVTKLTIGPDEGGRTIRASLPDVVQDPDCLDGLAGMAAASAALSTPKRPVRFELTVGGDTCGPRGGFASLEGPWTAATTSAVEAMRARGSDGPLLVVTDSGSRSRAVVGALRAAGQVFTEVPAERFDAAAARSVQLGSLVLVATDRSGAWPVVDELARANGATVPVVLAPWLLDSSVVSEIAAHHLSVLVATHRNPTSGEAVSYRINEARTPGGGWAVTGAGFEAYLAALEDATGAVIVPATSGVYSAAQVAVLPSDLDHPAEAGWSTGVAMIRVA